MPVPARAYELFANGDISGEELLELEKFAEALDKQAAKGKSLTERLRDAVPRYVEPQAPPGMFSNPARTALALGGLALAAPALAYAGSKIPNTLQAGVNRLRFERDLNRAIEVNPSIGDSDDPDLRMAYKTLQTTNPDYAKDPLIAGTILDMVMRNRIDPEDPSSAPRFDPAILSEIQRNRRQTGDTSGPVAQALGRALVE